MQKNVKTDIQVGAYGWAHEHWRGDYYPDDLPEDWQLAYYSNDFNCVLVPADQLLTKASVPVEAWLDEVHENFRFFVECNARLLAGIDTQRLIKHLGCLQPQLSALVFTGEATVADARLEQLDRLRNALSIPLYSCEENLQQDPFQARSLWQPGQKRPSEVALLEEDLKDLRSVRKRIEPFLFSLENVLRQGSAVVLVRHESLQAGDLARFRAMLEVMGY